MISNERRWPAHLHVQSKLDHERPQPPRQPSAAGTLESREIKIERKRFLAVLRENSDGRFLRITENAGGHKNTIIVPASGLEGFRALLEQMTKAAGEAPDKQPA